MSFSSAVFPPPAHHLFAHSHPAPSPEQDDSMDLDGFNVTNIDAKGGHHSVTLIDIHGILMVLAWLGLIPGAIFSARYLRGSWADKNWFGLKVWFQIHRTLNGIAVLLILLSTLLAFYARGKWTGPWFGRNPQMNLSYGAWNSLFGLFAIILAVRQPFNAFLRCAPDHPRRPLFNWMHRIAGLVAYAFAMVPLFIGVFVRRILHRKLSEWILISYHIVLFLLIVAAEFVNWLDSRVRRPLLDDHDDNDQCGEECEGCELEQKKDEQKHILRNSLFALLLLLSICCSTMLALFILMHD